MALLVFVLALSLWGCVRQEQRDDTVTVNVSLRPLQVPFAQVLAPETVFYGSARDAAGVPLAEFFLEDLQGRLKVPAGWLRLTCCTLGCTSSFRAVRHSDGEAVITTNTADDATAELWRSILRSGLLAAADSAALSVLPVRWGPDSMWYGSREVEVPGKEEGETFEVDVTLRPAFVARRVVLLNVHGIENVARAEAFITTLAEGVLEENLAPYGACAVLVGASAEGDALIMEYCAFGEGDGPARLLLMLTDSAGRRFLKVYDTEWIRGRYDGTLSTIESGITIDTPSKGSSNGMAPSLIQWSDIDETINI